MNASDPRYLNYTYSSICFEAHSFLVVTLTEIANYNFLSLVADVGGLLNIITLLFMLTFPILDHTLQPRAFLFFWLYYKLCRRPNEDDKPSSIEPKQLDHDQPLERISTTDDHLRYRSL